MKAMSSADKANVISLLLSGYSIRKVESITCLGKSTVGRIYQELEMDKENHKGGRPSKLSPTDERRIINQITTGRLDSAVQATNYINAIIQKPVCSQTVRNALKRNHIKAVVKAKEPLLKARGPNTPLNWPKLGSRIVEFRLWIGLPNHLTSTQ
jgi:transposase